MFINFEKAYDYVPINNIFTVGYDKRLKLINAIANKKLLRIKLSNRISFKVNKGLKQGCRLSPTLFKITKIHKRSVHGAEIR